MGHPGITGAHILTLITVSQLKFACIVLATTAGDAQTL
jgi:hypothetical protein